MIDSPFKASVVLLPRPAAASHARGHARTHHGTYLYPWCVQVSRERGFGVKSSGEVGNEGKRFKKLRINKKAFRMGLKRAGRRHSEIKRKTSGKKQKGEDLEDTV